MPNWVKNKVKFDRKDILKDLLTKDKNGDYEFDFNKVIPRPKSIRVTSGGNDILSMQYALSKMEDKERESYIDILKNTNVDFHGNYYTKLYKYKTYTIEEMEKENEKLKDYIKTGKFDTFENTDYVALNIHDLKDLGMIYLNNIKDYGCDSWYDWCCKYWDTKWNASATIYDGVEDYVEFETAWSMPYNIFKEISKKYNCQIIVEYADEDIGYNCGTYVFKNGEVISYDEGDRQFAYDVWGYTDEDIEYLESEEE